MQAIGVASTDTLPDASFSASSERTNLEASKGRLNAFRGWSPSSSDRPDDYLQIDLQYEFLICAVATQGRSTFDDWTTEYKLQLSFDGSTFVTFTRKTMLTRLVKKGTAEIKYRTVKDFLEFYQREILRATYM